MTNPIVAWSWSRLETYEKCPRQFRYRYIDKLPEPDSPAMARGSEIHKLAENFLKGDGMFPPAPLQRFGALFKELRAMEPEVEEEWAFTKQWRPTDWFAKGKNAAWLRVKCDAVAVDEDSAVVIDHKTGKARDTHADQMKLFADAAFCRYSFLGEVEVRLWYLDTGQEEWTVYQRKGLKDRMAAWEERIAPMFNDTEFAPKPSFLCRFCAFSKAEGGPCEY